MRSRPDMQTLLIEKALTRLPRAEALALLHEWEESIGQMSPEDEIMRDRLLDLIGPPPEDTQEPPSGSLSPEAIRDLSVYSRLHILPGAVGVMDRGLLVHLDRPYGSFAVVCTHTGMSGDARLSLNFTVEPWVSFRDLPPSVLVHHPSGSRAFVRQEVEGWTYWMQFVHHLPGRKLRFFGARQLSVSKWLNLPEMGRRVVFTDGPPWFREVDYNEFSGLPNVEDLSSVPRPSS